MSNRSRRKHIDGDQVTLPVRVRANLALFDEIAPEDVQQRRLKLLTLGELVANRIFAALKSMAAERKPATSTDVAKLSSAYHILSEAAEVLSGAGEGGDPAKIRDITAEMGRILGGNKGKRKHSKAQPPPRQGVTDA